MAAAVLMRVACIVRRVAAVVLGMSTLDALRRVRRSGPLKLLPDATFAPVSGSGVKTVYLVRHGESQWNVAQKKRDPVGMFGKFDHALTAQGVAQAEELRSRIRSKPRLDSERLAFDGATAVYCSPLTRAVQTALVALAQHPALRRGGPGLKLIPECRELTYPIGGFDSLKGEASDEVAVKVLRRARKIVGGRSLLPIERGVARIDASELAASEEWFGFETKHNAAQRLGAFAARISNAPDDVLIVVGHSLFFQALFANFAHPHTRAHDKHLRHLAKHKMPNAAVARLDWNSSAARYPILSASLVFTPDPSSSSHETDHHDKRPPPPAGG